MFSEAAVEIEAGRTGLPDDAGLYPACSGVFLPDEKTKQRAQRGAFAQIKGEAGPLRLLCAGLD